MTSDDYSTYLLHLRPFSDTRVLLELFDRSRGRFSALTRISKQQSKANFAPFNAFSAQVSGRYELKTLHSAEVSSHKRFVLQGKLAFCGLYLNELICRLLPIAEPHVVLFDHYEACLRDMAQQREVAAAEPVLRRFEYRLVSELGYGIDWHRTLDDELIRAESIYQLSDEGFRLYVGDDPAQAIKGAHVLAIASDDWTALEVRTTAKKISRLVLERLLDGKPLKSRELFV